MDMAIKMTARAIDAYFRTLETELRIQKRDLPDKRIVVGTLDPGSRSPTYQIQKIDPSDTEAPICYDLPYDVLADYCARALGPCIADKCIDSFEFCARHPEDVFTDQEVSCLNYNTVFCGSCTCYVQGELPADHGAFDYSMCDDYKYRLAHSASCDEWDKIIREAEDHNKKLMDWLNKEHQGTR